MKNSCFYRSVYVRDFKCSLGCYQFRIGTALIYISGHTCQMMDPQCVYLWVEGLVLPIRSGCVRFIPPLLDHLLHHLQLTGVRCGSALKDLRQKNREEQVENVALTSGPELRGF